MVRALNRLFGNWIQDIARANALASKERERVQILI
jgi:hypothetical protein